MKREDIVAAVEPSIRAKCPLSALQAAAVYRMDVRTVLDACELFVQSRGAKGLRCFRAGRTWRIRPASVEAWMSEMEEETAKCQR